MFTSIGFNYLAALAIGKYKTQSRTKAARNLLVLCIAVNLGLLFLFKYSGFFITNLNFLDKLLNIRSIAITDFRLPLGISFFTFHALSYVIDVYRGTTPPMTNIINNALYIAFFPQLIAGPIIRYHTIVGQFINRNVTLEGFSYGVQKFIIGLGKKVLIANVLAATADQIFKLPVSDLGFSVSWLGIICYTLQIYFDFSGYSDMAIGLARLLGFTFMENFNYPYISRSITDFWRRWHISLSKWFRDYLYIPLGGNRKGKRRAAVNIFIVFLLCGLWHGANWNFILWGAIYGIILVLEKVYLLNWLDRLPRIICHSYSLVIIIFLWVLFRSTDLNYAFNYWRTMLTFHSDFTAVFGFFNRQLLLTLILGLIFSLPVSQVLQSLKKLYLFTRINASSQFNFVVNVSYIVILIGIVFLSSLALVNGTYNPFIYFRF